MLLRLRFDCANVLRSQGHFGRAYTTDEVTLSGPNVTLSGPNAVATLNAQVNLPVAARARGDREAAGGSAQVAANGLAGMLHPEHPFLLAAQMVPDLRLEPPGVRDR